jgi:hypothetical protein
MEISFPSGISLRHVHLTDEVKAAIDTPGSLCPAVLSRTEVESLYASLGVMLSEWDEQERERIAESLRRQEANIRATSSAYQYEECPF